MAGKTLGEVWWGRPATPGPLSNLRLSQERQLTVQEKRLPHKSEPEPDKISRAILRFMGNVWQGEKAGRQIGAMTTHTECTTGHRHKWKTLVSSTHEWH